MEEYIKKTVKIYTDGSCPENPGKGGYGTILIFEDNEIILSGTEEKTTNNRMEMMAAIVGIEYLQEPYDIEIYSDSAYLINCFTQGWYNKWFKNKWLNSNKKPVVNKDLWLRLMSSFKGHKIKFIKVKGHADDEYNNRCDEIAGKAARS